MKCTFSSTVPAIVCGSRRKSRILFSFTLRPARASAISARSAYATVAWCFVAKPRGSMGSPVSNFCGNCAEPVGFAAAAWWSFPTTLPIIIPESTNPGGTPTPVALIWIFCRPTVPNSIRSNESGSSPAAFVYITAISNAWMVLSPPWRMNLRNGGLVTMSCADYAQLFKTLCLDTYYPIAGPLRRDLYPKHLAFFRAGAERRERAFLAANRVGKSEGVGGYEITLHLTGRYPDWWKGRRFSRPITAWAA